MLARSTCNGHAVRHVFMPISRTLHLILLATCVPHPRLNTNGRNAHVRGILRHMGVTPQLASPNILHAGCSACPLGGAGCAVCAGGARGLSDATSSV